jgi:hypothetical protein
MRDPVWGASKSATYKTCFVGGFFFMQTFMQTLLIIWIFTLFTVNDVSNRRKEAQSLWRLPLSHQNTEQLFDYVGSIIENYPSFLVLDEI